MDAELRRLWTRGDTAEAIAAAIGRSVARIGARRAQLDLPKRPSGYRPPAVTLEGVVLSVAQAFVSPQKLARARALLERRRDPIEVYAETRLPLRECYRLAAEIREARRG